MGVVQEAPRNAAGVSAIEYTLLDLPALILQCILAFLDPQSIKSLGSTCTGLCSLVEHQARRLTLPLDTLRKHRLSPQALADRYPAARALTIAAAHHRVALSCCGTLHRSLQIVNVFLDNARGAWGGLTSLDLLDVVPHIIPLTTDILVEGLPSLQHLALPGSSSAATEVACLAPLTRLSALRDLSLGSLHAPVQSNHPLQGLTKLTSLSLVCSPAMPAASSSSPAAAAAPAQPYGAASASHHQPPPPPQQQQQLAWAGLNSLRQLESLSVSSAAEVAALLAAAAGLPRLTQLSLRGARLPVGGAAGGGAGGAGSATARAALSALHRMKQLARLQFSPASATTATTTSSRFCTTTTTSSSSNPWGGAAASASLAAAAASSSVGGVGCPAPGAGGPLLPAGALHHLGSLAEVDLTGWTVDGPVLGALASCKQLRRLKVGGLVVSRACPPTAPLASLTALEVAGAWALGSTHTAADMLPGLAALSIRQAGGACPDLRPLKAHPSLCSLALEVGDPEPLGPQLAWLVGVEGLTSLEVAAGDSSRPWHAGVHLPQLRRLVLRRATSDAGLASLPGSLGALVSLTLEGCPYVSDHGLGKAAGLPFLEEVTLVGCPHVTEDGVSRLLAHTALQRLAVVGCGAHPARLRRLAARCRGRGPGAAQLHLVLPEGGSGV